MNYLERLPDTSIIIFFYQVKGRQRSEKTDIKVFFYIFTVFGIILIRHSQIIFIIFIKPK